MPDLCKVSSLQTATSFCQDVAGLKKVKVLNGAELDLETINAALSTYFDATNYTFKNIAFPLLSGGDGWETFEHDAAGAQRSATSPTGKSYYDVSISALRFQGYLDTKKLAELKRINGLVSATLLQGGLIIIDGISYDPDEAKLVFDNSLGKLKVGEVVENSGVFDDEIGLNTTLSIEGRTQHKGYRTLATWSLYA